MTEHERLTERIRSAMCWGWTEPSEIAERLIEDGDVIVPPCKLGDTVYIHDYHFRGGGVNPYQITNLLITQNKKGVWTKKYRAMWIKDEKTVDAQLNFDFTDIGKTVFLTREEAEATLAEANKKQNNDA